MITSYARKDKNDVAFSEDSIRDLLDSVTKKMEKENDSGHWFEDVDIKPASQANGSFSDSRIITVLDAPVISVEAGNYFKKDKATPTFIAFSVKVEGQDKLVKLILKGKVADGVYDLMLSHGNTKSETVEFKGAFNCTKIATVSFVSVFKEETKTEIKCVNPLELSFSFNYQVI